jgi:hypothetical protein
MLRVGLRLGAERLIRLLLNIKPRNINKIKGIGVYFRCLFLLIEQIFLIMNSQASYPTLPIF